MHMLAVGIGLALIILLTVFIMDRLKKRRKGSAMLDMVGATPGASQRRRESCGGRRNDGDRGKHKAFNPESHDPQRRNSISVRVVKNGGESLSVTHSLIPSILIATSCHGRSIVMYCD